MEGKTFPFERIAWLKILGVPLHLMVKEVFDAIGGKFGKVVHHVVPDSDEVDLSSGLMGVLVDSGVMVLDEVKLVWEGFSYNVWVKEDGGSWIPQGMGKVEKPCRVEDDELSDGSSASLDDSTGDLSGYSCRREEGEKVAESMHGDSIFCFGEAKGGNFDGLEASQGEINHIGRPAIGSRKVKRKIKIMKRNRGGPSLKPNTNGGVNSASPRPNK